MSLNEDLARGCLFDDKAKQFVNIERTDINNKELLTVTHT